MMGMDTGFPLVSVVIPTYQRESALIQRAVDSVQAQTYPNIEILVVDDNPDGSPLSGELETRLSEMNRVTYIRQDGNKGACAARNLGIQCAKGSYIAFLDDDDAWLPQKIEKQMAYFADGVGMVFSQGYKLVVSEDGSETKQMYYNAKNFREHVRFEDLLCYDHIGTTTQALVRKECFAAVGGFREDLPARQDYEMWLRISRRYEIVGVPEPLFVHYKHTGDQITKDPAKALKGLQAVFHLYKDYYKRMPAAAEYMLWPMYWHARSCHKLLHCCYYRLLIKRYLRGKRK